MNFLNMYIQKLVRINFFAMLSIIGLIGSTEVSAQNFSGALVLGINAAQIDGDGIYGYDKLGLTGGVRVGYAINNKVNGILEMLYSERGSSENIAFGNGDFNSINLKYLEIPLLIEYNDWLIEGEDYYKVGIEAGLSYGNLFSATTSNLLGGELEGYKKHDLSYTVGLRYSVNKHLSGTFRFSKSLLRIYRNEGGDFDGLISHWLSFRMQYAF